MKKTLVIGLGNIARKDDGIGVHVVNYIINSGFDATRNIDIIDGGMALHDFLPLMLNRKRIVIVDALKTDDKPGTIYRFPATYLKSGGINSLFRFSDLKSVLQILYCFSGIKDVEIIGIVPEDTDSEIICLSDTLKKIIERAACETMNAAMGIS